MEDFLRLISLILFYIFFIAVNALSGLLFNLHSGAWYGIVFSLLVLAIYFKYGEKIILLLAKARYVTDDEALVDQIKNLCTHIDIKEVKVYWSQVHYNNVYYVNSYWGTPSIIIGKEVYRQLSKNEFNSLMYATLLRIKTSESKHRSMVNIITLSLFWWVFLIDRMSKNRDINDIVKIFLYPAFYLRSILYKKENETEYFDREIFKHDNLKREYIAAIFKVNKLVMCQPLSMGAFVLTGLSHTFNVSNEPFMYLLIQNEKPIEMRVKYITGSLK